MPRPSRTHPPPLRMSPLKMLAVDRKVPAVDRYGSPLITRLPSRQSVSVAVICISSVKVEPTGSLPVMLPVMPTRPPFVHGADTEMGTLIRLGWKIGASPSPLNEILENAFAMAWSAPSEPSALHAVS